MLAVDGAPLVDDDADHDHDHSAEPEDAAGRWADTLDRLTGGWAVASPTTGLDLVGDQRARTLRLACAGAGRARGDVWLHNTTDQPIPVPRLVSTSLVSHAGYTVGTEAVGFHHAGAQSLPPRSSTAVEVVVDVPSHLAPPTVLRGIVVADGHEDVWLPIAVIVEASQ